MNVSGPNAPALTASSALLDSIEQILPVFDPDWINARFFA